MKTKELLSDWIISSRGIRLEIINKSWAEAQEIAESLFNNSIIQEKENGNERAVEK